MCLMRYVISTLFSSCPLPPTDPTLLLPTPLPRLLPSPPSPLRQLGLLTPTPTISYQPTPQISALSLTEVQNRSRCDVLRNRILPLQDISSNILKTLLLHCCLQQWLLPAPILPPICLPIHYTLGRTVMEAYQGPSYAGGQHPHL